MIGLGVLYRGEASPAAGSLPETEIPGNVGLDAGMMDGRPHYASDLLGHIAAKLEDIGNHRGRAADAAGGEFRVEMHREQFHHIGRREFLGGFDGERLVIGIVCGIGNKSFAGKRDLKGEFRRNPSGRYQKNAGDNR